MKYMIGLLLLSVGLCALALLQSDESAAPAKVSLPAAERSITTQAVAPPEPAEPATASAKDAVTSVDEQELVARLWKAFNTDLDVQDKPVDHDYIVQLVHDDPELAQALAQEARR